MFTGLVECMGRVVAAYGDHPRRLEIAASLEDVRVGDSVAIDGCCLTVVRSDGVLCFEAATETLRRTTLGALCPGQRVNLEGATRVGDRLGGHLVTGHVDAVGNVRALESEPGALYMTVQVPPQLSPLLAPQGSVTLAGVSLTVTDAGDDWFRVMLISHTLAGTTLGERVLGDALNLEVDLIARYVQRLMRTVT